MRILRMSVLAAGLGTAAMMVGPTAASAANCTTVMTSKGPMTTAAYDQPVTGALDATGCQIGVYYDSMGNGDNVTAADISGASNYGVFVDGLSGPVDVNVEDSSIHDIGDVPPDGVQRGVAVYYYGVMTAGKVTGDVNGNDIYQYQKGGIVVNGSQASVNSTYNTVTGLGPIPFIAQNGIQYGFLATGNASYNQISDNYYTGCSNQDAHKTGTCVPYVSAGLLLYDVNPSQVKRFRNLYRDNQRNELVTPAAEVDAHYT